MAAGNEIQPPREIEQDGPEHRAEPTPETIRAEQAAFTAYATGQLSTDEPQQPEPPRRPAVGDPPRHAGGSSPAPATSTQSAYPWRTTTRSVFQALVSLAAMLPFIYQAATGNDPAAATGWAAAALGIAGGIARVMAIPAVNDWLRRFLPFLATDDAAPARADE